MRLYLLRHAEAVPPGTPGFAHDADRPLTEHGIKQAQGVAAGLKALGIELDLILTSPYLRAVQTAQRVADGYGGKIPLREMPELRDDESPRVTSLALKPYAAHKHVICAGHNPHISLWLAELVTTTGDLQVEFKKGAVACVEVPALPPARGSGVLRWMMSPKQLARIGKSA